MQERLKEIVIYILENGASLEPEQRAELERVWDELELGSFPIEQIEAALSRALELSLLRSDGDDELIDLTAALSGGETGEPETDQYLDRLIGAGLIDSEQRREILARARRFRPEGPALKDVQFVAASIIFDETLGYTWRGFRITGIPTANIH